MTYHKRTAKHRFKILAVSALATFSLATPMLGYSNVANGATKPYSVTDQDQASPPQASDKDIQKYQYNLDLEQLYADAESYLGDSFAGITRDEKTGELTVLTTDSTKVKTTQGKYKATNLETNLGKITIRQAANTEKELENLRTQIIDNPKTFAPHLTGEPGGGVDYNKNKLVITIMDYDNPQAWTNYINQKGLSNKVEVVTTHIPTNGTTSEE